MIDLNSIEPLGRTYSAGVSRSLDDIKRIVIHCSAGRPGTYINSAKRIDEMHRGENGWDAIGYHYVIAERGAIQGGRPLHRTGAGVRGHNADSVHICLIGGLDADGKPTGDEYTTNQWASLEQLVAALVAGFDAEVSGHNSWDPLKACPCFNVEEWWENVNPEPEPSEIAKLRSKLAAIRAILDEDEG